MAVFTHIDNLDLMDFLKNYDLNDINFFNGINEGIQNTNYKIGIDSKEFILTIYENMSDIKDIEFFLELMMYLSSNNIKCPTPIKNLDSKFIGKIKSKPAVILTFLKGKSISAVSKGNTFELGKALADMHLNVQNFNLKKKNDLSLSGWKNLLGVNKEKLNKLEVNLYEKLTKEFKKIQDNWPNTLPSGIIHADLFPDNVLFLDNKVSGLIDFYFSCTDFFAYDLSICVNAWCFDNNNKFSKDNVRALISGYQEIRALSEEELNSLPILCSGSALRFLLTRVDNLDSSNSKDIVNYQDPNEFLSRLRFHQEINSIEDYGL